MVHHFDPGVSRRHPISDSAGLIAAPIVDHDHFERVGDVRHLLAEAGHDALDIGFLIMSGQKHAQAGQPPHSPTFP